MATSSILTNFTINDPKAAEAFINALEAAEKEPDWTSDRTIKPPVTDKNEIRALLAKRKKAIE